MAIRLYAPDEFDRIAEAGDVVDRALAAGLAGIEPGVTTADLGSFVERILEASGATPSLRGVRDRGGPAFPHVCCVSVNEELIHAPPRGRILRAGDLVTIDVAAAVEGWHADAARSAVVGDEVGRGAALLEVARAATAAGLAAMGPGVRWLEVAEAVRMAAKARGARVVPGFAGHGIGASLHEDPAAAFTDDPADDFVLRPGMALTLEPILSDGLAESLTLDDGWTVLAADRAWGCHEERTIGVTRTGIRVLAGGLGGDSGTDRA